ncbi:MAG: (E)-4-hydroxy-3-methylbut-2-enyl-diphosphate synthase [Spirochaetaceae bacterium]|jgi:(E)-4-hydroxy-3-methylbut-2-enyl-diphosphate synthase|nr:(E)-4-hydroxy-3-methylbut-2-enyl-diphosphate synthase [Spirochaetaceae bacterium]GMO29348.1 MAG: (E)-4-hydroxy-3-methylbut-2-enyl-diphosphate synthase [Termitinemataceae bacterium]
MSFAKKIKIGGFAGVKEARIGENEPLALQTMWKEPLTNEMLEGKTLSLILERIERLSSFGCSLLRFAVPDADSAEALGKLASLVSMPLVADIHFDYKLALRCLDFPIAKIRINPGNLGSKQRTAAVLQKCAKKNVPVRIGVNSGSLPSALRIMVKKGDISAAEALVRAAENELLIFEEHRFFNVVVSMKASNVAETIAANELFAARHSLPLHIGVTEAGPLIAGVVRNTAALYRLLQNGIGDTVRVSLSDSMENEILAAREIALVSERLNGARLISCPRCGRCGFDTHKWAGRWQEKLASINKNITVAVMGCAVNGPGEARAADIGITGIGNKIVIFKHGKITRETNEENAEAVFFEELARL